MSPILRRVAIPCLLSVCGACGGDSSPALDETQSPILLVGGANDPAGERNVLAGLQMKFLRLLTSPESDPSGLMSTDFTMRDVADTADVLRRAPGGGPGLGLDYLRALSERVPQDYSAVASMQIVNQRPNHAIVVTRHPGVLPSVTRWDRVNGEWKAVSFVINVPEEGLTRLIASGPRS